VIGLMLGAPSGGKGTQSDSLDRLGYRKVSSGDLLRRFCAENEGTETSRQIADLMREGELVPDDLMKLVLADTLNGLGDQKVILDGFPRTVPQAEMLKEVAPPDWVIFIDVPKEEAKRRAAGRLTCPQCSTAFGTDVPPKLEGICDHCGAELERRPDDKEEATFNRRWKEFEEKTLPVVDFYRDDDRFHQVDGTPTRAEIGIAIRALIT